MATRTIDIVHPSHALGHKDLLLLGRIHVTLATHNELGALHGAVPPDLRVVAIIADNQRDLEAFRSLCHISLAAGVPALDYCNRHIRRGAIHKAPFPLACGKAQVAKKVIPHNKRAKMHFAGRGQRIFQ